MIRSRAELDASYAELEARYPEGEQVPAPPNWGGFRVAPQAVEFWQGRENRYHDGFRYRRAEPGSGAWIIERLAP